MLLLTMASALDSRSSAQVFRSSVTVGVLDVIVTDDRGRSVSDLTKSDFEVTDEGDRRDVVSASFVSISTAPSQASAPPATDVFTNSPDVIARRLFVIVVDDLNTSPQDTMRTRAAAKTIVQALPDGDLIAVVFTAQQVGAREFTSNKARLLDHMNQFVARSSMFDNTENVPLSERDRQPVDPATRGERSRNLGRALETLQNVAVWLAPIEGRRKAVLYITAGLPSDLAHAFIDSRSASPDFQRLVTLAMQANVAIYPVDARGLAAPDDTDSSAAGLWALANDTGGIATINTNDIGRAVNVAVRDSSAYYMVGYSLSESKTGRAKDPRLRRVRVRVLRPGLTVRTRLLSASGPGTQERAITTSTLLASPLPGGHIPVAVHAASFAATGGGARVLVTLEVGGDAIRFSERDGKLAASLQYRIVATDVSGRVAAGESKALEFNVSATRRDQIRDSRTRLVSSLQVPSGTYRIRAAVLDSSNGEHGMAAGDLEVPRYDRGVSLSTVEITSTVESRTPTMRTNLSLFETRLSGPPTSQRTFPREDTLDAFAEVYARVPLDQVRATVSLSREHGQVIDERGLTLTREKGIGGVQCFTVRTRVPLAALEPADYRMTLAVQTPTDAAERSISFVVK
jgi:VWFA-related protein